MPPMYADAMTDFYRDGGLDETTPLPTVEHLPLRPPRTCAEWTQAHLDEFR
jgi:hypothetical protein